MKIRTKSRMHCAQNTATTLHINLLDDKTLGFHHCCHKHENCNSLDINEFYKMTDSEFKIFLEETYKILRSIEHSTFWIRISTSGTEEVYAF